MKRREKAFAVIAGNAPDSVEAALGEVFSHVVRLPSDSSIAPPVSFHPDMIFAALGDTLVTHERYYREVCGAGEAVEMICTLGGFRLVLGRMDRGAEYPRDVGFNALVYRNALIGRLDALAEEVLCAARRMDLALLNVKQGYAACSTLVVPKAELVCTSDKGIEAACERCGADVVRLPSDAGIRLPGYNCGFIGGCTGVWDDMVFFCGNPMAHPSLLPMCDALRKRGITIVPLSDGALTDYGGIRIFSVRT